MKHKLNRNSERIPRSLLRGLASELQQINPFLAWKIPCTLVQGASIRFLHQNQYKGEKWAVRSGIRISAFWI